MTSVVVVVALGVMGGMASPAAVQVSPFAVSACEADVAHTVKVHVPESFLANGQLLAAGDYEMRVTTDHPEPAAGQSPAGECWVEFVKAEVAVGREVASVIPDSGIADVAKAPAPRPNSARVEILKGGEYLRIWFNVDATNYLIHLPVAVARRQ